MLADQYLRDPVQINVGAVDLAGNPNVTQIIDVIDNPMDRLAKLKVIFDHLGKKSLCLIFTSTKVGAEMLTQQLSQSGVRCAALHGDKSQAERDYAMSQFRRGEINVLVATDVAARGLDIKNIEYVINYDFPSSLGNYVHRIGRTGRAGAKGISYTFISHADARYANNLIQILRSSQQSVPEPLLALAKFSNNRFGGGGNRFGGSGSNRFGGGSGSGSPRFRGGSGSGSGGGSGGGSGSPRFRGGSGNGGGSGGGSGSPMFGGGSGSSNPVFGGSSGSSSPVFGGSSGSTGFGSHGGSSGSGGGGPTLDQRLKSLSSTL